MTGDDRPAVYEATEEFIEEYGESPIEALLEVDAENEMWEFDDIPLGSGTFGEVVSHGIVEKTDGTYRIADWEAVHAVLTGEQVPPSAESSGSMRNFRLPRLDFRSWFSTRMGLLLFGLGFIAFMRSVFHYDDIFRDGTIVLPANDPYRRRYWLEQLVESDLQPWNPFDLASIPEFVATADVFFYWITWTAAALFGNSVGSVSMVLVWYPIVVAMLTGLAVYALAVRLTGDFRVGVASVFMLALIPIHASYTALGFGDHHALDYFLLTLIAGSLVLIVDGKPTVRVGGWTASATWVGAAGLGVSLAAMNAAWNGAPLWFAGVCLYVVVQSVVEYYRDRSPLGLGVPILAGLVLAAVLTLLLRFGFGWLQSYRVVTPLLVVAGVATVLAAGEAGHRLGLPSNVAISGTVASGGIVTLVAWFTVPPFSRYVRQFASYLDRTGAENITETVSLFSPELDVIGGPLSYIGGAFVLAVPVMAWFALVAVRDDRPEWLVVTMFGWYLFGWAAIQVRFAAEFAVFAALFAGIGFVALLAWVDLIPPISFSPGETVESSAASDGSSGETSGTFGMTTTTVVYVCAFFLFLSMFSFIFIPSFMADITVDDSTYETAAWIGEYSDEQGYEYPENYVFTPWGENRHYNYFVSGEPDWYGFAQQHYLEFVSSDNPDEWYPMLSDEGRFLVTHDRGEVPPDRTQSILHERFGSRGNDVAGAAHYRAKYVHGDGERVVFELVPGARLTGTGEPNAVETVEVPFEIEGASFTYERQVETNRYGDYGVTVPYPGKYGVFSTDWTVVTSDNIEAGEFLGPYRSHWTLDEGTGETISDSVGGHSATVEHGEWVDGVEGHALRFDGEGATVIEDDAARGIANGSFTVSFWVKGDLAAADADFPTVLYREGGGNYGFWARLPVEMADFGFALEDVDGNEVRAFGIERTSFEEWTLITGVLDRDRDEVRLYQNDTLMQTVDATSIGELDDTEQLAIGGKRWGDHATVAVDNVRAYATALDEEQIEALYDSHVDE